MTDPNVPQWKGQKSWTAKLTMGRVTLVIVVIAIVVGIICAVRS